MEKYSYVHNWFINSELKRYKFDPSFLSKELHILEIGSYEGLSSCYFSDNFINHESSSLTCVDPFDIADPTTPLTDNTETIFKENIKKSKNSHKCIHYKGYSNDFFKENKRLFDFIYIDGSHQIEDIKQDFENSIKVIKKNGIIWMDDYLGGAIGNDDIKNCIDDCLEKYKERIEIIHKGYQIAFRII